MKQNTKHLAQTALLLAVCIASQFFKNLSPYITGPIVNTVIILAVLAVGLYSGLLISVISPVTAFFISGSPVMAAIPAIIPSIMLGNCILAFCTSFFTKKTTADWRLPLGLVTGSCLKAAFMGLVIVCVLLPNFGGSLPPKAIAAANVTFSLTQLITALTGSLLAFIIWIPLKNFLKKEE